MARKRIGEVLLERGLITAPQLAAALGHQQQGSGRLGLTLVALGALSEIQLTATLGDLQGLEVVDLSGEVPDWTALQLLRREFYERHLVLPLGLSEERGRRVLRLAVADGLDLPTIDAIEYQTNTRVRPVLAAASQIRLALARWLPGGAPREVEAEGGGMMLIRPGGAAELVQTDTVLLDADFEVEEGEMLPLPDAPGPRPAGATPPPAAAGARQNDYEFLFGPGPEGDRLARLERRLEGIALLLEKKGLCSRRELELLAEPRSAPSLQA